MKRNINTLSMILGLLLLLGLTACPSPSDPAQAANIAVTPSSLNLSAKVNQQTSSTFTIGNTGNSTLTFNISENENFLTLSPSSGSVAVSGTQNITVTATCPSTTGTNPATITISSNDPDAGTQTVSLELTCAAANQGDYAIDIEFSGSDFNASRQAVFQSAANRWAEVIKGDLDDIAINAGDVPANSVCGFNHGEFVGQLDDLVIFASISPIDGEGGILGQAGPSFTRKSDGLTLMGCMQFDSADVAKLETEGSFENVILHEMGHVIGIGTLWENKNLLNFLPTPSGTQSCSTLPSFTTKPTFTGSNANTEFTTTLNQSGIIPAEDQHGQGTQCGHWDEDYFDTELMTGFAEGPNAMPMSRMTIASLQDLGYVIDQTAADAYAVPGCSPTCDTPSLKTSATQDTWEVILSPKGSIGPDGEIEFFDSFDR